MLNKTKIEKTGDYMGKSSTGNVYHVNEFCEYINVTTISDSGNKWHSGMKIYRLLNGNPVNHIEGDVYEIVGTKEKITLTAIS